MKNSKFNKNAGSGSRCTRQRYLIVLFLLPVVITRAMVPPGYMPSPIDSATSITMFMLCGGDTQSAQLIDAWEDTHSGEHTSHGHLASHGFKLCKFEALSFALADLSAITFTPVIGAAEVYEPSIFAAPVVRWILPNHPVRAPPPFLFISRHIA